MRFGIYCRTYTYCDCLMLRWTSALALFLIAGKGAEARTNRLAGARHRLMAAHWSENVPNVTAMAEVSRWEHE